MREDVLKYYNGEKKDPLSLQEMVDLCDRRSPRFRAEVTGYNIYITSTKTDNLQIIVGSSSKKGEMYFKFKVKHKRKLTDPEKKDLQYYFGWIENIPYIHTNFYEETFTIEAPFTENLLP